MKSKIQLKRKDGSVFFEYETKNNSVKKTVEAYINKERVSGVEMVDLSYADLSGANLRETNLENVSLVCADLSYTDLSNANLNGANLNCADLTNADLTKANLTCAELRETDLSFADLKFADLYRADLKDAKLSYAKLSNAILNSVKNLQCASCYFTGHGECGRQLLAVEIDNEIILFCGCFKGNEAELRKYIEEGDEKYKASRLMALEMVLKFIEVEKLSI